MADTAAARADRVDAGPVALDALADPVRRRLLELLAEGDSAAGTLVELIRAQFGISQPATSQHLKVLRDAGLVVATSAGRQRIYRLDRSSLTPAAEWLTGLLAVRDQPLDALETELARGRRGSRQQPRRQRGQSADADAHPA